MAGEGGEAEEAGEGVCGVLLLKPAVPSPNEFDAAGVPWLACCCSWRNWRGREGGEAGDVYRLGSLTRHTLTPHHLPPSPVGSKLLSQSPVRMPSGC